ncbi:MAG: LamG domain-containing protein [Candidatus Bathyarchaeota archaeon]|nr:LamG domain-containing protein [Candidatus Bathyarchaeota archaeon]
MKNFGCWEVKNEPPNKKNTFILLILLLILSIISVSFVHDTKAQEISSQEKALTIIADVVGVDVSKHTINPLETPQNNYLDVLPQEDVRYTIGSNGSREADVRFSFVNGHLRLIHVLEYNDALILKETKENPLEQAKAFLSNYQDYSKDAFYGQINGMLTNDAYGKNLTVTQGNLKLEATSSEYYSTETYRWTYTSDGVEAPRKCVVLGYENGFLKYFIDNWALYKIGTTCVDISEKQAVDIAMQYAKDFSWNMGTDEVKCYIQDFTVANAMVWETVYLSNLYADTPRSEDPLELYPIRHVWVSLDKFYPGNVYGINVYLWADTGDLAYIHQRVSSSDPPPDLYASSEEFEVKVVSDEPKMGTVNLSCLAVSILGFSLLLISLRFLLHKANVASRSRSKLVSTIFCFILLSSMFLIPVPMVDVSSSVDGMEIWGSESSGAYNQSLGLSWRKSNEEIYYQDMLGNLISFYASTNGYDAVNSQGDDNGNTSFKDSILDSVSYNDATYPRVIAVDFDHGNGNTGMSGLPANEFHYCFEDNNGTRLGGTSPGTDFFDNGVYDYEIYPRTASGKARFVLINACNSAHYGDTFGTNPSSQGMVGGTERARGMPFAWSHRVVYPGNSWDFDGSIHLSSDGYHSLTRDDGDFVYLGFIMGSASLNQTINESGPQYWEWLRDFFYYAFYSDQSVNDALDDASMYHFDSDFADAALSQNFPALWPMWDHDTDTWKLDPYNGSRLVVYGNGDIHLYRNGGLWDFDEGSGSTAYDSFVHGNDLTKSGATWNSGKMGSALNFDGTNDYVYRSYSSTLNGLSDVTLMQWVKLDSIPASHSVNLGGVVCEYWFEYRSNQYVSLSTYINSQYNGDGFYANLADGKWHLLTMTYDGVYKKGYLDGSLMAEYYLPGTLDSTYNQFKIGASYSSSQDYNGCPDGLIDEVRVYDYAFYAEQIADEATLLSYHLNGGDDAYDSSPFSNTGTIYGASMDSGMRGGALSFDGNDYVVVPSSSNLNALGQAGSSYSIALWFKTDVKADQSLTEKWIGGTYPFVLRGPLQSGQVLFALYDGTHNPVVSSNSDLADDAWHYVVATVTRGEKLRLYVDGDLVSEADDTTVGDISNSGAFPLGARSAGPSYPFEGLIDEFRIYDRVLSGDEVSDCYDSNLPCHWIKVDAVHATYGLPLSATFVVDGDYFGSSSYVRVVRGEHVVFAGESAYHPYFGWLDFDYLVVDGGNPIYDDTINVSVSKDTKVVAYYS